MVQTSVGSGIWPKFHHFSGYWNIYVLVKNCCHLKLGRVQNEIKFAQFVCNFGRFKHKFFGLFKFKTKITIVFGYFSHFQNQTENEIVNPNYHLIFGPVSLCRLWDCPHKLLRKCDAPNGFDLGAICGMDGASVCHDPSSYLSWDGMHLSEAANERVANGWLNGPYCHPPILKWSSS